MKVVVVGGGRAAYVKLKRLLNTYSDITCVSKEFCPQISDTQVQCVTKDFYDLDTLFFDNFDLIYLSLPYPDNSTEVDHFLEIVSHLEKTGKLFSVSSKPELGNFITPASRCADNVIVSVSTSGKSPSRAVAIADSLIEIVKSEKR